MSGLLREYFTAGSYLREGSEETLALLGTPNGCGVAWLLVRHNEVVGRRIIRVGLWSDLKKQPLTPNLLFHNKNTEALDVGVEKLFACIEKLGIGEAGYGESMHGPFI